MKAAIDDMLMNEHNWVPVKLDLQKSVIDNPIEVYLTNIWVTNAPKVQPWTKQSPYALMELPLVSGGKQQIFNVW